MDHSPRGPRPPVDGQPRDGGFEVIVGRQSTKVRVQTSEAWPSGSAMVPVWMRSLADVA